MSSTWLTKTGVGGRREERENGVYRGKLKTDKEKEERKKDCKVNKLRRKERQKPNSFRRKSVK